MIKPRYRNRFIPKAIITATLLWLSGGSTLATADDTGPFSPLSFNNGVQLFAPGDAYRLGIRFRMQNLVVASTELPGENPAILTGQVRRLRLRLFGNVASPALLYTIQLSFTRDDMDWANTAFPSVVRDASLVYRLSDSFQISFGQTKLPGNRQRVVSSGELQLVDRSIVNRAFNLDRDFGLQFFARLLPTTVPINLRAAISTGEGRNQPNPNDGLAYTGRIEVLPFGEFSENGDYFEGDLAFESTPRLSLGVGYSLNDRANRSGGQIGKSLSASRTLHSYFADAMLKFRGASLYLEALGRDTSNPIVSAAASDYVLVGYGFNVQAGYFVATDWEAVLRFSSVLPRNELAGRENGVQQATLGMNHYLSKHRAKLQLDLTFNRERNLSGAAFASNWILRAQVELGI